MSLKKPEILAPAGSMESLTAALRCGADAVYIGGKKFSARSSASNFSVEELSEAADKCHLYNAKLYLAVNTVIFDEEAAKFCDYIKKAAAAGIDAFIVQDLGAAELIHRCVPDAVLHASTQMTVHTAYGAGLLKALGFGRVVPARELDKDTIAEICSTGIETEVFVHGALCMSVSGQCYMSAVIGSRSANRGCCGQACRLPFSACGNKNAASLSLKDLSLIPIISQLEEIGADSLKIEGRMKRPEYVAAAVDALYGAFRGKAPDMQTLRGIFSRGGFTDGYFTGKRSDMFGVREKDDVIAAQTIIPKIHELYRYERKVRKIDFHVVIRSGQPVRITAFCGGFEESVCSDIPQIAQNRPTDMAMLEKQLSRLGDTVFELGCVTAEIDDGLIVPAGKLNELRRILVEKMNERIISELAPNCTITGYEPASGKIRNIRGRSPLPVRVFCRTAEQVHAAVGLSEFVTVPHELLLGDSLNDIPRDKVIVSPPRFIVNAEKLFSELTTLRDNGFTHLLCHTPDTISMGKRLGFVLHGGFGLNTCNSYSADALKKLGLADFTASFELKISQMNSISAEIPMGAVIYGRLPLMLTRNCPVKNEIGCKKCRKSITDRTGRSFMINCSRDYVEILNSDILYMSDKLNQFDSLSFGIIMLNDENAAGTVNAIKGVRPDEQTTRGLYYRGI
ncbi:MAG: U32 family peptidase [Ruminococcus sp.]|nr:U32 family peptidase [Ruminococcus sp.]